MNFFTTVELATMIGTDAKTLRKFFRAQGITKDADSGRYAIHADQIEDLKRTFWDRKPARATNTEWTGTEGLPIEWVSDPARRGDLLAERRARAQRLDALLREKGLTVPQMNDKVLAKHHRALTRRELAETL